MKEALYFVLICVFAILLMILCSCSNITKTQTELTISDLNAIEHRIDEIGNKMPSECKTIIENDLNGVIFDLNEAKKSVEQINKNCNAEKKILKQENTIQVIWLVILFALCCLLGFKTIKK